MKVLYQMAERLREAGALQPRMELAELLRVVCRGASALDLLSGKAELNPEARALLEALVARRAGGEPLAYLVGRVDFGGIDLEVEPGVFIAREDTLALIDSLRAHSGAPRRILDLGTGTGALAIAAAKAYPLAEVDAVERSARALACAARNIERCGLRERVRLIPMDYAHEEWPARLRLPYSVILANPPYIPLAQKTLLPREVLHEPAEALFSGEDGLIVPRHILRHARPALESGGLLIMEIGDGQLPVLCEEVEKLGWFFVEARPDCTGHPRALVLKNRAE